MIQRVAIVLVLAGCQTQVRPECSDAALAQIEAAWLAEIITACDGQHFDTCDARPAIDAKYDAIRKEWIQCQN